MTILQTQSIVVKRSVVTGTDILGNDVFEEISTTIDGVLWHPLSSADLPEPREHHDRTSIQIYIPSEYTGQLKNSTVTLEDGRTYSVVGDSQHYYSSPLDWDRIFRADEVLDAQ